MQLTPGTYRIKNVQSGTTFDQSRQNRNVIHGWRQTGQQNQHWYVQQPYGGDVLIYHLKNVETGQYAFADSQRDSSRIQATGNPSEWRIFPTEDCNEHAFYIAYGGSEHVIDLDNGKAQDGTTIHLWGKWGARQQRWRFEKINDNSGPSRC